MRSKRNIDINLRDYNITARTRTTASLSMEIRGS